MGRAKAAVLPVPVWAIPITSRRDMTTGMVCTWIGGGGADFSSTIGRAIGWVRTKRWKEVNEALAMRARPCAMRNGPALRARTPRGISGVVEMKKRARDRLTGIRTRGSQAPDELLIDYVGPDRK